MEIKFTREANMDAMSVILDNVGEIHVQKSFRQYQFSGNLNPEVIAKAKNFLKKIDNALPGID